MQLGIKIGLTQLGGGSRVPVIPFELLTLTPAVGMCTATFTAPSGVNVVSYEAICRQVGGDMYRVYPVTLKASKSKKAGATLTGTFDQYGDTTWDIFLLGKTDDGQYARSNSMVVKAAPQHAPAIPVLTEAKTSGHSVYLSFPEPASEFPIEYYEETLNYEGVDYTYKMSHTVAGGVVTALALSPAGTYLFRVRATNKSGTSDWSAPIEGTADLYPPQLALDSYESTETGVLVTFNIPPELDNADTYYVQGYSDGGDTVDSVMPVTRTSQIAQVGEVTLASKGIWRLAIRASNAYGNGTWSNEFDVIYNGKQPGRLKVTKLRAFAGRKIIINKDGEDVGRLGTEADDFIVT